MFNSTRQRRRRRHRSSSCNTEKLTTSLSTETRRKMVHLGGDEPSMSYIMFSSCLYVLSGVTQVMNCNLHYHHMYFIQLIYISNTPLNIIIITSLMQPILMAYAQQAGLANPKCQLYMLFYYIGPALVATKMKCRRSSSSSYRKQECSSNDNNNNTASYYGTTAHSSSDISKDEVYSECFGEEDDNEDDEERLWPSKPLLIKASCIALFDIFAQSMCYTGNNLAGPTIFAIIYSSVTIWTALFSKVLLSRSLSKFQWLGVCFVVIGLSLTAKDSSKVGQRVFLGAMLILVGSSFHGLTYVMSEIIMTAPSSIQHEGQRERQHISIHGNCAVQGIVATGILLMWQIIYTFPHRQSLILDQMAEQHTTPIKAIVILITIALANLLHSVTFYTTLKHFPGGATSAGVLKGLQAVLVFAASAIILCGSIGGVEMCWSRGKFISLVIVVFGIMVYGMFTEKKKGGSSTTRKGGYHRIENGIGSDDGKITCV